jgi:hypothetical protein
MKLITEIIEILSSDTGKLSDALIKTKVLLHKIGHKELVPWVNSELNGYPDRESVPEYRVLSAQVLVNASNGAYRVTSHHIPMGHLEERHREAVETAKMDQSLAVLEKFTENDGGHLRAHIPMESYRVLGQGLGNHYQIESAWSEVSHTSVLQILIQVRSRLLDFVLELNDQFPSELDEEQVKKKIGSVDAENLFNSAIFGDNTTILVGNSNAQTVSNVSVKGDFSILAKTLEDNGVSEADITALNMAIEQDSPTINPESKEYGPAVKSWLQSMLSKAVDASWNIELGVASSLLATALNSYYGWF